MPSNSLILIDWVNHKLASRPDYYHPSPYAYARIADFVAKLIGHRSLRRSTTEPIIGHFEEREGRFGRCYLEGTPATPSASSSPQ